MGFVADTVTLRHLFPSNSVSPCQCRFIDVSYLFTLLTGLTEGKAGEIWKLQKKQWILF